MPKKKNTVAIKRLDTFYLRAKIAGYRARSAFKLIQLNQKYEFLEGAKVCLDLCAAPGSWMQVASKTMKPPSVVIGVDLNPIQPVPNAMSIQGDITTDKVRQELKNNLRTYKADVVLHDGAPNVGNNWHHDAYAQNVLVLHAFRLACEFLKSGGTFVTKVFRSKDHTSLEFVFKKLFNKVESTKPKASRFESAEIFIVCQGFFSPQKIDVKFFDPKHVFSNIDVQPKNKIDLRHPDKTKKKAEGYEDGITMLFKRFKLSSFIDSPDYIEMLEIANEFVWDLPEPEDNAKIELRQLCKDIKVLGRKDIRALLNFRKHRREEIEKQKQAQSSCSEAEILKNKQELELKSLQASQPLQDAQKAHDKLAKIEEELTAEESTVREFEALQNMQKEVDEIKAELLRESKRKVRKLAKVRAKMMERMQLKLMVPGDPGPQEVERGLFSFTNFHEEENAELLAEDSEMKNINDREWLTKPPKYQIFSKNDIIMDSSGDYMRSRKEEDSSIVKKSKKEPELNLEATDFDVDEDAMMESLGIRSMEEFKKAPKKGSRFIDSLLDDEFTEADEIHAEKWFSKDMYANLEDNATIDYELDSAIFKAKQDFEDVKTRKEEDIENVIQEADDDSMKSDNEEENVDFEAFLHEVPEEEKLSDVGLALAAKMMSSKKGKRTVIEDSFNRRMYGDEDDKPEWFEDDEKTHNDKRIEVDPEDLQIHRKRTKNVDARTIKKVVEAKARKARRMKKKMEKANEKVKVISDQVDLSAKEKSHEIKKIFAKIGPKKKEVRYVPMKKGSRGVKSGGAGKGPYKMVDRRLKKDKLGKARVEKKRKRGRKGKKGK